MAQGKSNSSRRASPGKKSRKAGGSGVKAGGLWCGDHHSFRPDPLGPSGVSQRPGRGVQLSSGSTLSEVQDAGHCPPNPLNVN